MKYIVIDNFNKNINIICKDDNSGELLILDSLKEAEKIKEECQDGQIIPLGIDLIYLINELYGAVTNRSKLVHIGDLIGDVLDLEDDVQFP